MKFQRGFTLIELMIVVAIIAILAGILIPNFTHARAQAQTAACESNLRQIATAMELFYADNQRYPATASVIGGTGNAFDNGTTVYLNNTPQDPAANPVSTNYTFTSSNTGGQPSYVIKCPGTHDPSTLQKVTPGTKDTTLNYSSGTGLGTQ